MLGNRKGGKWNSSDHDPEEFRLSLVEHLDDLRRCVFRSLGILVFFWIITWIYERQIFDFLTKRASAAINASLPKGSPPYEEILLNFTDAFMNMLKISFFSALILSFPFIVLQIWSFIAPGLKPSEQKPLKRIGPISLLLFVMGGAFCWFILPSAFAWFASYLQYFPNVSLKQEAGTMAMFTLKSLLAFGIGFQLPLVVYVLGALNLLSAKTLQKHWRHATFAIFFLSAGITPSNDPATMIFMAVPLTLLFLISVYAVKMTQRKKQATDFLIDPDEVIQEALPGTTEEDIARESEVEYEPVQHRTD
ncbi:MAG TPA: twin-arginine translocase subunit TatC [Fimbriimonas sp.]|nr:twin-arginine translocase subunit TatC [Fimbriimonas sp.]